MIEGGLFLKWNSLTAMKTGLQYEVFTWHDLARYKIEKYV
jgi:hypothetical protein